MLRRLLLATAFLSLPTAPVCRAATVPTPPPPPATAPSPPAENAELARLHDASRFLAQTTLGADRALIERVATIGPEAWLEQQLARAPALLTPLVLAGDATLEPFYESEVGIPPLFRLAWWHRAVTGEDLLRQRVALALSEIFVVSDRTDALADVPSAVASFYDVMLRNAFGNVRQLLIDVTLHPAMGVYLSHLNNARSDPATGRFPDENYAREVMQLFSIGLFRLRPDGRQVLDADGLPIPTYGNREVTAFAKVFTGLGSGGPDGAFGEEDPDYLRPMRMYQAFHEPGEKVLLDGFTIPAGQPGMVDVHMAIGHLFRHPNIGPFLGYRLIQRLVTSNPTPGYVARVTAAFNGQTGSERGDMKAILRAIFLDPEARAQWHAQRPGFGRVQEPFVRYVALARALGVRSDSGWFLNQGYLVEELARQHVMSAPSVFNFFQPNHRPHGVVGQAGLVAPELQISNSTTVVGMVNLLDEVLFEDYVMDTPELPDCEEEPEECELLETLTCPAGDGLDCFPGWLRNVEANEVELDLDDEVALASNVSTLLDHLDLVLTHGSLSDTSRATIAAAVTPLGDPEARLRLALYLLLLSPDYAVAN